ncbi:MAG: helix-turn-helix domain-containing protein, partial [Oscillospiraceae bacterium]
ISKDGHKLNGNLCYTICPIEEAIQYSFDRQMQKAEQENAKQRALKRLEKYDQASKRKVV